MTARVRLAQINPCTEAEGPGRRFAVWLQGCGLGCPGCCNPEMLPLDGGHWRNVAEVVNAMAAAQRAHAIEGLTLLGGEPLAQPAAAADLAAGARALGLGVMVFSGHTRAEIENLPGDDARRLLAHTDVLVDGRYDRDQPDDARRWVGSRNQRVWFLTSRHHPDEPCWRKPNTLEIVYHNGELRVNGFPAAAAEALSFWRGLPKAHLAKRTDQAPRP